MTETYEGVANDGLSGFFSGLTWGLIGTVSKPALGVLDLATGAATAVKESSRSKYRVLPPKLRPPRYIYIYFTNIACIAFALRYVFSYLFSKLVYLLILLHIFMICMYVPIFQTCFGFWR